MKIDLRDTETLWINLDSAKKNAEQMVEQFDRLGIKNHKRISARVIPPPALPPVKLRAFGKHFVGCGQSHIDALSAAKGVPFLILEDDAAVTDSFFPVLDVPEGTHAVYLGVSHGNAKQVVVDQGNGWMRIGGMLTTHAILYLSETFAAHARQVAKECIYTHKLPLDNGFAALQKMYKVLAYHKPMFVQSDLRESANKWERLTSAPLRATHKIVNNQAIPLT